MLDWQAFFVAELGFDPDRFWELSFYEWSLYLRRHETLIWRAIQRDRSFWRGVSVIWSVLMRGLLGANKAPTDLIDFDEEIKESKPESTENLIEQVKQRDAQQWQTMKH